MCSVGLSTVSAGFVFNMGSCQTICAISTLFGIGLYLVMRTSCSFQYPHHTPLMEACRDHNLTPTEEAMSNRPSIMKRLLARGADLSVSKLTVYKYKPLMADLH